MKKVLRFVVKKVFGVKTWNDFVWFAGLLGTLLVGFPVLMMLLHWDFGFFR